MSQNDEIKRTTKQTIVLLKKGDLAVIVSEHGNPRLYIPPSTVTAHDTQVAVLSTALRVGSGDMKFIEDALVWFERQREMIDDAPED